MLNQVEPDLEVEFDLDVFNEAYIPLLEDDTPTQILFGGSSSGKSFFYAQRVVFDLLSGGRNYLIVRKVAECRRSHWRTAQSRRSVFREVEQRQELLAWEQDAHRTLWSEVGHS